MATLPRALAIRFAKGSCTLSRRGDIACSNTLGRFNRNALDSASHALIRSFFGLALLCASRRCFLVRRLGAQNVQQALLTAGTTSSRPGICVQR
ncbi:hypothetical protein D8B24_17305 [Verminephrobacter aporrectodeae subsp. tuberculatae]|nr:hypothetical protein [Verminephrobacter aporrectodeae subsp. tuberculatae]